MHSELTVIGYYVVVLAGAAIVVAGTVWLTRKSKLSLGVNLSLLFSAGIAAIGFLDSARVVPPGTYRVMTLIMAWLMCVAIVLIKENGQEVQPRVKKLAIALAIGLSLAIVHQVFV
jgi:UDP-N-acetylmuramyl pentapeptide phosphotransferase/UDP-N-acetylglucosamine-1-phosphate transferase